MSVAEKWTPPVAIAKRSGDCDELQPQAPECGIWKSVLKSRVLPPFEANARVVRDLIPELYLHGLAEGDFLALRGLLGEEAPLSPSTVARLKRSGREKWRPESGVFVGGRRVHQSRMEKEKARFCAAVMRTRCPSVAVIEPRELVRSAAGIKERGNSYPPRLVIADGHLGIWGARNVPHRRAEMLESFVQRWPRSPRVAKAALLKSPRNTAGSRASQDDSNIGVAERSWRQRLI